jgi:hypothetical protein
MDPDPDSDPQHCPSVFLFSLAVATAPNILQINTKPTKIYFSFTPTKTLETMGVTKRCRLSLLTNSALVGGGGSGCGVSANEYSCALHLTWSPNKLWRPTSIFNLCLKPLLVSDVDLEVKIDLQELQDEFNLMTESQMIGVVNDQE